MQKNELNLSFLGGVQIFLGEQDLTQSLPLKAQALLSYAVLSRRTLQRHEIGGLFWGSSTEERARTSLRVAIRRMNEQGLGPFLNPTRTNLSFQYHENYRCDVEAFEQLMATANSDESQIDMIVLRQAVDLYRGDFLHGFLLNDSPDFDMWLLGQRERLRQMALVGLDTLISHYIDRNQLSLGIEYAHRLLELDPWRESAHRQLMWLFASNGQRGAALTQFEKCRELLLNELNLEPDHETILLAEEIKSRFQTETLPFIPLPPILPAIEEANGVPFQAPERPAYFIGHKRTIARLAHLALNEMETTRFCLTGMGGVGKTTLMIELAYQLRQYFADGVLWATAVSDDPMLIAEQWANAYGYDFAGLSSLSERAAALRHLLAQKQALIMIDEVSVAATIRPLLPENGRSIIIMASRQADVAHRLKARQIVLTELTPKSSYKLLAKHINEHRVDQEREVAYELCAFVGHLPLAIALIGGYLNHRPYRLLTQFMAQLRAETNRLPPGANASLRGSMEISWQSLDEAQKRVFSYLSIFSGRSFSLAAMASILNIDIYQTEDYLEDLIRFSLLHNAGEFRYRQHPVLADYSREKLGDERTPQRGMVMYYLQFVTEHQTDFLAFLPEWGNLDAAIIFAYEDQEWEQLLYLTAVLHDAWFARGRFVEASRAFAYAETAAYRLENEHALAQNWFWWGEANLEQSEYSEAKEKLDKSLSLYEALDSKKGIGDAQRLLARIALVKANYDSAKSLLDKSNINAASVSDSAGIAATHYQLARLANSLGNYDQAKALCETAVAHYQSIANKMGLIPILRLSALILVNLKLFPEAKEPATWALRLANEYHAKGEKAVVLSNLASIERNLGNFEQALQYIDESLAILELIGDRRSQAVAIYRQMLIYRDMEDVDSLLSSGSICLPMFREFGDLRHIALTLTHMGNGYEQLNHQNEAVLCWQEALEIAEAIDHQVMKPHLEEKLK